MSIDLNSLPAFGKCPRDEAWARVRRSHAKLDASPLRLGLAFGVLATLAAFLLMDAATLVIGKTSAGLWLLPAAAEPFMWNLPGLAGPVLMLLPISVLYHLGMRLLRLSLSNEPVVFIDYTGIATETAQGWQIHLWNEIAAIKRWPGFVALTRARKGFSAAGLETKVSAMRVFIPSFLIAGGEAAFADALASVRPELARQVFGAGAPAEQASQAKQT